MSKKRSKSYATIYRERTIAYRQEGHTLEETSKAFKVSISIIQEWEKRLREKGDLEKKPLNRPHKKIDPDKFKSYVEAHPDAYQSLDAANGESILRLIVGLNQKGHTIVMVTHDMGAAARGNQVIMIQDSSVRKTLFWRVRKQQVGTAQSCAV